MQKKKDVLDLLLCYILWGFQPLYWALLPNTDSYLILACRIIMSALFSVLLLALSHRLGELRALLRDRAILRYLLPAVVFLLADWAVYIVAVNSGHVLDCSLGYYINPLLLFAFGVLFYKERCSRIQLAALCVAAVGVAVSTAAYGEFPTLSLVIAVNWSGYAILKKNVRVDGVVSIAAETLILTPLSLLFILFFRMPELSAVSERELLLLLGSGVVTALPMFLYSDCVFRFSLIVMCFAQYLSPSFGLLCGYIMGESFTKSQLVSFVFFIAAIVVFTFGEIRNAKHE